MRTVAHAEGMTQRQLADLLASDPNTIAAMAARLEKHGLIRRKPHERNSKARSIYMTPAGRRQLAKLEEAMKPVHAALSACFTGEDGEKGLAALDQVYRTLTKLGNSHTQGERQ
jgi:DNA-binding MarR family transcriptional regulator